MNLFTESCCPESSCSELGAHCHAQSIVDCVICQAVKLLELDPAGVFLYKNPPIETFPIEPDIENVEPDNTESSEESKTVSAPSVQGSVAQHRLIWHSIREFNLWDATIQVREFIGLWHLTPATKCALVPKDESGEQFPPLGTRYQIQALFSKPTPSCPNPLPVARVDFFIHVSDMLPDTFPVMVTYRFEGYKSLYYAVGERAVMSLNFQRLFIDSILHIKLAFYSEVVEYRETISKRIEKEKEKATGSESEAIINSTRNCL